jgi:hypothetical protein
MPIPYVRVNSPTGWVNAPSTATPQSAANLNQMDQGIVDLDATLNASTGSDGASLPSGDGPFTFANWLNYILTLIKNITGKAHWYTAPVTSIESLNTTMATKANLSGATFTGTVNVSSGSLQQGGKNVMLADNGLTGKVDAQGSAPGSPAVGDLWIDTSVAL